MPDTWRDRARRVILARIGLWLAGRGAGECLDLAAAYRLRQLPLADRADLARFVNRGYPFVERACHPYRVWCRELRALRRQLGLPERTGAVPPADLGDLSPADRIAALEHALAHARVAL